jgi:hypothetical protein
MVQDGEVYFLKMNNGEDLLCIVHDDSQECLYVTQPYRIELMPGPDMTITTSIIRWLPFSSLMGEKIRLDKRHVMAYILVDEEVSIKYANSIARERNKDWRDRIVAEIVTAANIANTSSGSIH